MTGRTDDRIPTGSTPWSSARTNRGTSHERPPRDTAFGDAPVGYGPDSPGAELLGGVMESA